MRFAFVVLVALRAVRESIRIVVGRERSDVVRPAGNGKASHPEGQVAVKFGLRDGLAEVWEG